MAIDLIAAYQRGVQQELAKPQIVFDPFHVTSVVSGAVDEVGASGADQKGVPPLGDARGAEVGGRKTVDAKIGTRIGRYFGFTDR